MTSRKKIDLEDDSVNLCVGSIALNPRNDEILVARGILGYDAIRTSIADFEQAIKLRSRIVWPYFYLAHHYLANSRFEECRSMCERARHMPAPVRIQSELCEFLAMSMSGLGYPESVIRRSFEEAIRLDPSNHRAQSNLKRFNAAPRG